ncbi:MAG: histidine kinase, partial [Chloroflexota bacterium]|nr:histidine kinase [Chloroflexota bacterium]
CLPPLSAAVEVAVYRIAQEAITNVVRHAQARSCVVRLAFDDTKRFLCLEVLDDGIGHSAQHKTGVGLHSMRERAEEIGGSCTIEPAGSEGTRVVTCLPCQNRLPTADTENTARSEKL